MMRRAAVVALVLGVAGCSTTYRPCSEAGDLTGLPVLKGNKQCYQKKQPDGRWVDHGEFLYWYPNGKVAVEGTLFEGKKTGVWNYYDESGKKTAEKFFKDGVETTAGALKDSEK